MSAWTFAKETLLNRNSPACLWRHPRQASRLALGALGNAWWQCSERMRRSERHTCPICGWQGRGFRTFLSADEVIPRCICPDCGSFDRHRLLALGLRREVERRAGYSPDLLLGFSLSPAIRLLLQHEGLGRCFRADVQHGDDRFAPDLVGDLRRVPIQGEAIDWLFCSHVLEHIPELDACLDEMVRLLRPGGIAWIQVPQEPGLELSRRIEIDPYRAHAHAWQFGEDFGGLLARPEWGIKEIVAGAALDTPTLTHYGIHPDERYWLARKA